MLDENKYLKLNDIEAYKISFHLSNYVWDIVLKWDLFAKKTIKFYRYSFGSTKECFDWNEKAKVRKLVNEDEYRKIFSELDKLPKAINSLIKYTNEKLSV